MTNETYEHVVHEIDTLCNIHNVDMRDVLGEHMYLHYTADVSYIDECSDVERVIIFQYIRDAVLYFVFLRDGGD